MASLQWYPSSSRVTVSGGPGCLHDFLPSCTTFLHCRAYSGWATIFQNTYSTFVCSSLLTQSSHDSALIQFRLVWHTDVLCYSSVKAPLHDTIRPHGACRLPCTWSIVTCNMSLECPGHVKIGWKGFTARSIFEPILLPELCDYPIRAQQTHKTTFTLYDCERETGRV